MIEPDDLSVAEPPRPKFVRLSRNPKMAVRQMAGRIKFQIEFCSEDGRSKRVRTLRRQLHSCRYPEWDDAIELLVKRKYAVIHGSGRNVAGEGRVITLRTKASRLPDPYFVVKKKKRKRKRLPTAWFLERRHLMDQGIHSGFATIEPWHESAFWIEKEKMEEKEQEDDG
jgi:hypothetical protein